MMRLPDWEARLSAYLMDVADKPHAYGAHDCALHGANAVLALSGIDHGEPFRGQYTTALGAARALRKFGAGSIEVTFDTHLTGIPTSLAARGDIVMAGNAIGVCVGGDALFVGQEGEREGLVRKPRREWDKAWRVPFEAAAQ